MSEEGQRKGDLGRTQVLPGRSIGRVPRHVLVGNREARKD